MLDYIIKGGPLMVPLLVLSVLALGVALDRWSAFRRDAKIDTRTLRAKVLRLLNEGKTREAADLCTSTPGPVAALLLAGVQAYARHSAVSDRAEVLRTLVQDALEDYAFTVMRAVEKRLNVLSFIGSSAPLFGMTGTVTGMIKSFSAIAGAGALEGGIVAAGISEALTTTAAGLMIAIGAVIPYHHFMSRTGKIEQDIHEAGAQLLDFVTLKHTVKQATEERI